MYSMIKKAKLPNTLAFRLSLSYAVAFIVLLLLALTASFFSVNSILNQQLDEDLEEDIEEFQLFFEEGGINKIIEEIEREARTSDSEELFFRLLDANGISLFDTELSNWHGIDEQTRKMLSAHSQANAPILATHHFKSHEYPTRMIISKLTDNVILHMGETMENNYDIREVISIVFFAMFVFVIPIALFAGWWVTKHSVRGITAVSRAAQELEKGKFDSQVIVHDQSTEIQLLADTFNAMAERIRHLIAEMREMTDNIAHDLRSPIARIRAISEQMLSSKTSFAEFKNAASDTLEECDRLIHMINTALDVAEAEAGISAANQTSLDLAELVNNACELFEPLAEQKQISLTCSTPNKAPYIGNRQYLQRMVTNLIDNALKYTDAKGSVTVTLAFEKGDYVLKIIDSGIGIPAAEQEKIFERFYRCDQSRSKDGCGLGLSFSSAVVRNLGGRMNLESQPNQGSIFTIVMPAHLN